MHRLESFHLLATGVLVALTLAPSSVLAQATQLPTGIPGADAKPGTAAPGRDRYLALLLGGSAAPQDCAPLAQAAAAIGWRPTRWLGAEAGAGVLGPLAACPDYTGPHPNSNTWTETRSTDSLDRASLSLEARVVLEPLALLGSPDQLRFIAGAAWLSAVRSPAGIAGAGLRFGTLHDLTLAVERWWVSLPGVRTTNELDSLGIRTVSTVDHRAIEGRWTIRVGFLIGI